MTDVGCFHVGVAASVWFAAACLTKLGDNECTGPPLKPKQMDKVPELVTKELAQQSCASDRWGSSLMVIRLKSVREVSSSGG